MAFHLLFCSVAQNQDCTLLAHLIVEQSTHLFWTRSYLFKFGKPNSSHWPSKNEYDTKMSRRKYVRLEAEYIRQRAGCFFFPGTIYLVFFSMGTWDSGVS